MQGKILGSRYRVIKYIAKGGFGKTYLAEDIQLPARDKCVVKQLYPSLDDPNFIKVARRLFSTEAQTLNTLGVHNQIPRLMAYFEEDKKFYLVQQYIEGHTLSKELVADEPWSESKVIELLLDCLGILGFVHSKGVIHRDVKPDNLICRQEDNKLVLVDFGTVKEVIAEQTQIVPATVAVGTRGYMPTEQARGKPKITSDIYALGIIAIEALTGIHPTELEENDDGDIIWRDDAQCSLELKQIVSKMTEYHFKERYQSAAEVSAALTNLHHKSQIAPQTEAVQDRPAIQLSDAELTVVRQPQDAVVKDGVVEDSVVNSGSKVPKRSIVLTPGNQTTQDSQPRRSLEAEDPNIRSISKNYVSFPPKTNPLPKAKKSGKTWAIGLTLAVGAIAAGGIHFFNKTATESAQNKVAQQVAEFESMLEVEDYEACYQKAAAMPKAQDKAAKGMSAEKQQEFEAKCGLAAAQAEADALRYDAALAIATTLPETPIQAEIQAQIDSWSGQLLTEASKVYEQEGDLEKAIALVKQIPQDSSVASQAIDVQTTWKEESQANGVIITTAEKALSEEKWVYAKQQAIKVQESSSSMHWQEKAQAIISQAEAGIAATAPPPIYTPVPEEPVEKPVEESVQEPVQKPTTVTPPVEIEKSDPVIREPIKVDKPIENKVETEVKPTKPAPEPTVVDPKPTERVKQDLEPLRDLNGGNQSVPDNSDPVSPEPVSPVPVSPCTRQPRTC